RCVSPPHRPPPGVERNRHSALGPAIPPCHAFRCRCGLADSPRKAVADRPPARCPAPGCNARPWRGYWAACCRLADVRPESHYAATHTASLAGWPPPPELQAAERSLVAGLFREAWRTLSGLLIFADIGSIH